MGDQEYLQDFMFPVLQGRQAFLVVLVDLVLLVVIAPMLSAALVE
jgi:hypothetical protein